MTDLASADEQSIKVFISSVPRRDEKLRDQLVEHLAPLGKQGLITCWHDGMLSVGEDWEQEITKNLNAAQVILILLSAGFIGSEFCYNQMERALKRHEEEGIQVIPVYLRRFHGIAHLRIGRLALLPKDKRPVTSWRYKDLAWSEIVRKLDSVIRRLCPTVLPPSEPEGVPVYHDMLLKRPPVLSPTLQVQRTSLIETVSRLLLQDDVTALMLTGLNGVGKTTLAAQVYQEFDEQWRSGSGPFAEKPLWFEIKPTDTLVDLTSSLCKALERPLPPFKDLTMQAIAEEFLTLVKNSARLIVLDQFEGWLDAQTRRAHTEQAGVDEWLELLNASSQVFSGRILLTSYVHPHETPRHPARIREFRVRGMEPSESIELLRMHDIPATRLATEEELTTLAERYQGHAQTLVWLRELLERDANVSIDALLHRPHGSNRQGDSRPFHTLTSIYAQQLHHEQRALLLAFSIYREAVPFEAALQVAEAILSAVTGLPDTVPPVLLDLDLLHVAGGGCYRPHPIVAEFAQTQLKTYDRHVRLSAHLQAARYYQGRFEQLSFGEEAPGSSDDFHLLIEAVWHLCQAEQQQEAYYLMQETHLFADLSRRGNNAMLLALYMELLSLKSWPPSLAAPLRNELGEIRNALGQKQEALQEYSRALELFKQIGQPEGIVEALNNLGAMHRVLEHYQQAHERYQEALRICEEVPHGMIRKGTTLNNLGKLAYERARRERQGGNIASVQGYYREALRWYEQAGAWYRAYELREEEAYTFMNMGDVLRALEEVEKAQRYYWQAILRFQECGTRRGEGMAFNNLGLLYYDLLKHLPSGKTADASKKEAQICCLQALRIFRTIGDRWQEGTTLRDLGRCFVLYPDSEAGPFQYARWSLACFIQARNVFTVLHNVQGRKIPSWIEENIRLQLAKQSSQTYEEFFREVEAHAEEIIEEMLNSY